MPVIELLLPANMQEIINAGKYAEMIGILNTSYKSEGAARFEMLKMLTGLNGFDLGKALGAGTARQRRALAENISLDDCMEIAERVFPALDFIFGNEKFYVNPFPSFTHKGMVYEGPSSGRLSDQTAEEWMVSHQQLFLAAQLQDAPERTAEMKQQEWKHLVMFVAANYHRMEKSSPALRASPSKGGQTARAPFTEEAMERDAEALADLPEEVVKGILLWYTHANGWWAENFAWLFTADEGEAKAEPDGQEIRHLVFELSGNKIDSAWDVVSKRSRQDIIYALDRLEKRREQMEEAAEEAQEKYK